MSVKRKEVGQDSGRPESTAPFGGRFFAGTTCCFGPKVRVSGAGGAGTVAFASVTPVSASATFVALAVRLMIFSSACFRRPALVNFAKQANRSLRRSGPIQS